jgi:hypothetical protein
MKLFRRRGWRLIAKALGEKASECDRESDRVALIRLLILASYLITNCFIIAGVLRHWGPEGTQDTPIRGFKGTGDGCSTHATTVHEVDEVAIKLVGGHAGQFG